MSNENILFLYHDPCTDGLMCRVIAERFFSQKRHCNVTYVGANPSTLSFDIDVILKKNNCCDKIFAFDVSITPDILRKLTTVCADVHVYDHHESTAKAFSNVTDVEKQRIHFDNSQCGAQLAWNHFFPDLPTPSIISYVQVRDLWLFGKQGDLPRSKEITTYLYDRVFSLPFSMASTYQHLLDIDDDDEYFEKAFFQGTEILTKIEMTVADICSNMQRRRIVLNQKPLQVGVVESSLLASEIGNHIVTSYNDVDFALIWCFDAEKRLRISLRSDAKRCNVNDVAKSLWGGGGHAAASGALLLDEKSQTLFLQEFSI